MLLLLCYIHIRYILPVFSLCSSGDEGDVGFDHSPSDSFYDSTAKIFFFFLTPPRGYFVSKKILLIYSTSCNFLAVGATLNENRGNTFSA